MSCYSVMVTDLVPIGGEPCKVSRCERIHVVSG